MSVCWDYPSADRAMRGRRRQPRLTFGKTIVGKRRTSHRPLDLTGSVFDFMGGLAGVLPPIAVSDFRTPLVIIAIIEILGVPHCICAMGKPERVKE